MSRYTNTDRDSWNGPNPEQAARRMRDMPLVDDFHAQRDYGPARYEIGRVEVALTLLAFAAALLAIGKYWGKW